MRTRRGLSTVVGAVFAVIVISTSIGYVAYSMNLLQNYNTSVLARNQLSTDKASENFQLYSLKIAGSKFNVTIANTGSVPVNITRMWVQNTTATDWVNYYTINKAVNPGALLTNIGQSSAVNVNTAYAYNIKLATSRGNSIQFSMGSTAAKPLYMLLTTIPNSVTNSNNVTMLLMVINNMSSNNALVNVQANTTVSCISSNSATFSLAYKSGPTPSVIPTLPSGGIAIFKYQYLATVGVGSHKYNTCTAKLLSGASGNTASDTVWSSP